jgi:2'-5' RNA ligase
LRPAQRKAIAQWRGALQLRSGRPVPVENFHLTQFWVRSAVGQIADICTAVASVRIPDARLTVALRIDWMSAQGRVLVLAPEQAPPALLRLVYDLEQALLPFGLEDAPGVSSAPDPGPRLSGAGAGVRLGAGVFLRADNCVRIP